ncbi:MAG: hypothetical protein B9S32_14625 [Verrucomicrobia bacterium Tous-C9LFEB]|nr:MAG: hypothetical protein B9S32_14625 [Verrucomicrobia bacterium Tous-C9LFEB]
MNAPARFVIEVNQPEKKARVASVRVGLPDSRWAELPVTVYDTTGKQVGARWLWSAPGEVATVVFDSSSEAKRYFLYVGSSTAPADPNWTPEAGVALETRSGDGRNVNRIEEMLAAWKKSTMVLGRSLLPTIFEGGHRHGPQTNLFSYYQGWFDAPTAGKYEMAVISTDAGFILVDGKLVVEWPGKHAVWPGTRGQFRNAVDLEAGPHKLEYYNAYWYRPDGRTPLVCCMAVKTPTTGWVTVRPGSEFFRPMTTAHVAGYELIPEGLANSTGLILPTAPNVGFEWEIAEQSVTAADVTESGFILIKFRFYRERPEWTCTWSFDDGTTVTGSRVEHLYLKPGVRQVKLTVTGAQGEIGSLSLPVNVRPNWTQLTTRKPELTPVHRDAVLARDPATISAADWPSVVELFTVFEDADALVKITPAVTVKLSDFSDVDLVTIQRAAAYLGGGLAKRYANAEPYYQALIDRAAGEKATAATKTLANQARLQGAQVILKSSNRVDDARTRLNAIDPLTLMPEERKAVEVMRGDLALAAGDVAGAKKIYLAQTAEATGADARSSIRRTAKIDQAAVYMEKKDFESAEKTLDDLEKQSPIDKLASDVALTRLRLYQERGESVVALIWARRLLPVLTDSGARSQLLFRLTDLAFTQGERDSARKTLKELVEKYPYSESTAQAKGKWPSEIEVKK